MRIGIIEFDFLNHYLAIDSLLSIYLIKYKNVKIDVFGSKKLLDQLQGYGGVGRVMKYEINGIDSVDLINRRIETLNYDRVHLITVDKSKFLYKNLNFNAKFFIGIHFTDEVFTKNIFEFIKFIKYSSFLNFDRDFFYNLRKKLPLQLEERWYKRKIVKKVLRESGKLVVYGESVLQSLQKFVPNEKIVCIPFCVYKDANWVTVNPEIKKAKIKVLIPGIIHQLKRDYIGLLKTLEKNLKGYYANFELIFLGQLCEVDPDLDKILNAIASYRLSGGSLIYFDSFISEKDFQQYLSNSDIILGNLRLDVNYGQSRETGVVYNMVRSSKPGILPEKFNNLRQLSSSTIRYKDYESLSEILIDLISGRIDLGELNKKAQINSSKFLPQNFVDQL